MDSKDKIAIYSADNCCTIWEKNNIIGLVSTQDFMDGKSLQVKLNDGHENINTRIKAYNTATQLIGRKNPECPTFYMEENTQEYEQVLETLGWAKDSSFEEILLGEGNAFGHVYKTSNPYYQQERKSTR